MMNTEYEYASTTILRATTERLQEKKAAIEAQLAAASLRLMELTEGPEGEPKPITAMVRTGYYEYDDDGYIGGHRLSSAYPEKQLKITANHFMTIYLATLAKQGSPVPYEYSAPRDQWSTRSYSSRTLGKVEIGGIDPLEHLFVDEEESEARCEEESQNSQRLKELFETCEPAAIDIVKALRDDIIENNPYQDIPIKINRSELVDALLRIELLRYCAAHDSSFSVEEVEQTPRS